MLERYALTPEERLAAAVAEVVEALRELVRAEMEATSRGPDRLLSVREAAEALGVGRSALYGLMATGAIRSCKVGRRRLVPSAAIAQYISAKSGDGG